MIDLFYSPTPNARKVLMALEELDLEYQIRWVDMLNGDQFDPAYVQINPNSKIPAVIDHDGPGGEPIALFESGAILMYLSDKTGRLLPADPRRRWEAVCWVFWQMANQGPMIGQATHFTSYAPQIGIEDDYARGRYSTEVARLYTMMEVHLAKREYIVDEFSIADLACFPWTRVAKGHGVDISAYPAVKEWSDRIAARPSAKVKIPDQRDEKARRFEFTPEQFQTIFRPG